MDERDVLVVLILSPNVVKNKISVPNGLLTVRSWLSCLQALTKG